LRGYSYEFYDEANKSSDRIIVKNNINLGVYVGMLYKEIMRNRYIKYILMIFLLGALLGVALYFGFKKSNLNPRQAIIKINSFNFDACGFDIDDRSYCILAVWF